MVGYQCYQVYVDFLIEFLHMHLMANHEKII
jgi:hypothetical protein